MFLEQAILSFLATYSFAMFFSLPKENLKHSGFVGMIGWLVFFYGQNLFSLSVFLSAFLASLIVSIVSDLFAIKYKKPTTLFMIPGLLPLVPGAGVYYTMLNLVEKLEPATNKGVETLLVAGSLALGIIVSSVFSSSIRKRKY